MRQGNCRFERIIHAFRHKVRNDSRGHGRRNGVRPQGCRGVRLVHACHAVWDFDQWLACSTCGLCSGVFRVVRLEGSAPACEKSDAGCEMRGAECGMRARFDFVPYPLSCIQQLEQSGCALAPRDRENSENLKIAVFELLCHFVGVKRLSVYFDIRIDKKVQGLA